MATARGLLTPFRRDRKRDFASGEGDDLLASQVEQVLATEGSTLRSVGELPWRTFFGTPLEMLRHQRNDAALEALGWLYIRDALARWLPDVSLLAVEVQRQDAKIVLLVRFRSSAHGSTSEASLGIEM